MSGSSASPSSRSARPRRAPALAAGQRVAEHADDARPHRVGELVEPEMLVGAGHFLQELRTSTIAEVVGAERAHATMPKSASRIITGLEVPHLLPVNSRVTT
jgi:hypothetical protein